MPVSPFAYLGNEVSLEAPWEYDYTGASYRTQDVVRWAVNSLFTPGPGGLPGNDDLGETSSWYVFAALGMYPETPGTANMTLASPLFPRIAINRSSGQVIQINAPGASTLTYYVQSLMVNGQVSTKPWLNTILYRARGHARLYALDERKYVVRFCCIRRASIVLMDVL